MIISIIKPAGNQLFTLAAIALTLILCCFKSDRRMDTAGAVSWSNRCLNECYNPLGDGNLKKWEMSVSADLFVRLRKTYVGGRQEYYSFRIKRFNDLNYLGTAVAGTLQLKTDADNIIQQTYNDPRGDQDNMVPSMSIPVRNMEPEKLDSLRTALLFLRNGR